MYPEKNAQHSRTPKVQLVSEKRSPRGIRSTMFKKRRDHCLRKLRKQRLINHLRSEFAFSTTHGLPYIVNQNIHWCERLFWALSFFGNLALVFYLLAVQLMRFLETPIVMSVEMDYFNWNVSYPAFTLCPLLKVDSEAFEALNNTYYVRTGKNLEKYLWTILTSSNLDYLEMLSDFQIPPDVSSLIDPKEYAAIAASVFMKFDPTTMTTNTNWPISVDTVMTELGMCHVVNSNVAAIDDPLNWNSLNVTTYSRTNIELSIHDRDFFTQITNYAEIYKVYIHNPDETILSTTPSYTHSMQGFMSFGVQMWISKISEELHAASIRLRKCRLIDEPISKRFPIYSYNRCMLECRIQMILKICGCVPHFYKPLPNERVCNINELKCIINNKKEILSLSATEKMLTKFRNENGVPRNFRDCGCVSLCDSVIYQKDYDNFLPQSDFNRLRIGISNFPKIRVVREIIFSGYEIILKIGGAMNLCIGASIISLIEMFVTFVKIPIYALLRKVTESLKLYM